MVCNASCCVSTGQGLQDKEVDAFKTYFYGITAQQGSGERALRHLLAPGAFAHVPLVERLRDLQVGAA